MHAHEEPDARIGMMFDDDMSNKLWELAAIEGKHPYDVVADTIDLLYGIHKKDGE